MPTLSDIFGPLTRIEHLQERLTSIVILCAVGLLIGIGLCGLGLYVDADPGPPFVYWLALVVFYLSFAGLLLSGAIKLMLHLYRVLQRRK